MRRSILLGLSALVVTTGTLATPTTAAQPDTTCGYFAKASGDLARFASKVIAEGVCELVPKPRSAATEEAPVYSPMPVQQILSVDSTDPLLIAPSQAIPSQPAPASACASSSPVPCAPVPPIGGPAFAQHYPVITPCPPGCYQLPTPAGRWATQDQVSTTKHLMIRGEDGFERIGIHFDVMLPTTGVCPVCHQAVKGSDEGCQVECHTGVACPAGCCPGDCCDAGQCPEACSSHCQSVAGVPILNKIPYVHLFKNVSCGPAGAPRGEVQACQSECSAVPGLLEFETAYRQRMNHLEQAVQHLISAELPDEAQLVRSKGYKREAARLHESMLETLSANEKLRQKVQSLEQQLAASKGEKNGPAVKHDNVVLNFTASWCGPCQTMAPIVSRLQDEHLPIEKIDVDHNRDLATQYHVTSVPCFVRVANGKVVEQRVGTMSECELRELASRCASPSSDTAAQEESTPKHQAYFLEGNVQFFPNSPQFKRKPLVTPSRGAGQLLRLTEAIEEVSPSAKPAGVLQEDVQYFPAPAVATSSPRTELLTNVTIESWLKEGALEQEIVNQIRSHRTKFEMSADALQKLRDAGATDSVIQQMRMGKIRELIGR